MQNKLRDVFGFRSFRPGQQAIIKNVLKGQDQLVVMATGFGKSLCFQFPAVMKEGLTICISPLISLMQDQVSKLESLGIGAARICSADGKRVNIKTHERLKNNEIRVLYISPEFASTKVDELKEIARNSKIICWAIDEAHCVAQWGHNFRVRYRDLSKLREIDPKVPFLAMTATATSDVRNDIVNNLDLRQPKITVTQFDRPNLYLEVIQKTELLPDIKKLPCVKQSGLGGTMYRFDGPTIIYANSRNATEGIRDAISGIFAGDVRLYHAGLKTRQRTEVQEEFMSGKVNCIVATIAFGMGIDKSNVRNIIHYGAPRNPDTYYQEIGRAGRDGLQANCYVFWAKNDFRSHRFFLIKYAPLERERQKKLIIAMEGYLEHDKCRRLRLLQHFDEKATSKVKGKKCCDYCKNPKKSSAPKD